MKMNYTESKYISLFILFCLILIKNTSDLLDLILHILCDKEFGSKGRFFVSLK